MAHRINPSLLGQRSRDLLNSSHEGDEEDGVADIDVKQFDQEPTPKRSRMSTTSSAGGTADSDDDDDGVKRERYYSDSASGSEHDNEPADGDDENNDNQPQDKSEDETDNQQQGGYRVKTEASEDRDDDSDDVQPSDNEEEDGRSESRKSVKSEADEEDDNWEAAVKEKEEADKPSIDVKKYGSAAERMMAKMGYNPAAGLGASKQGRMEPVELSTQRGRTGFGTKASAKLKHDFSLTWDAAKESLEVTERPVWMPDCDEEVPKFSEMTKWIKEGNKITLNDMETQTEFCDAEVVKSMLEAKNVFDELSDRDLHNARQRANPYETVKGAIFQNRAAMKMANMDAVFDYLFTNPTIAKPASTSRPQSAAETDQSPGDASPKSQDSSRAMERQRWCPAELSSPELFYFADICAGPGGFSEYVLWRRGFHGHGFGFTLKGHCDFKLDKFLAASPEFFETYYGEADDGDIFKPQNLQSFKNVVMAGTGTGVHLVMADGGFSVEGQENLQEVLSKRLYLCQFLCAINILRPGGNFVCKLFDVFTEFSVGLVYLMWLVFDRICIHKPHTSRPANSERYLICQSLRARNSVRSVQNYLDRINRKLDELSKSSDPQHKHIDVIQIVPLELIRANEAFYQYITLSNESIARRQTVYLDKYRVFAKNTNLTDCNQMDLREKCLSYWRVPDEKRPEYAKSGPMRAFQELCQFRHPSELLSTTPGKFPGRLLQDLAGDINICNLVGLDYRAAVTTTTEGPQIWMGLGRIHTYVYDTQSHNAMWKQQEHVRLPRHTLIYAEYAQLCRGQKQGKLHVWVLRIFDAFVLAGTPVHQMCYAKRQIAIRKFCAALRRDHNPSPMQAYVQIVPAQVVRVCNLPALVADRMSLYSERGATHIQMMFESPEEREAMQRIRISTNAKTPNKPQFFICRGLALFRPTRDNNWIVRWSRSQKSVYYFNRHDQKKHFETEKSEGAEFATSGHADFSSTIQSQINWLWRNMDPAKVERIFQGQSTTDAEEPEKPPSDLTIPDFLEKVKSQLNACGCEQPPASDTPLTR